MAAQIKSIFVPSSMLKAKTGYGYYNAEIDGVLLANDVTAAINEQLALGYTLFNTQPVISTQYYGRVYTEGFILLFNKADD